MDEDSNNEDNIPLSQWLKARNLYHCDNCTDLGDYVDVDNNVATLGILTESEILIYLILLKKKQETVMLTKMEVLLLKLLVQQKQIVCGMKLNVLELFTMFCESQSNCSNEVFKSVSEMRNHFTNVKSSKRSHQIRTEDYFSGS